MKLLLLIASILSIESNINCENIKVYHNHEDIIKETRVEGIHEPYNITYMIETSTNLITTIRILELKFTNCKDENCCEKNYILIRANGKRSKFCNIDTKSKWISLRDADTIEIILQIEKGIATLWIEYKSRNASECPHNEFQCTDNSSCYNSSGTCDHQFECKDHSDEMGCTYCSKNLAPCDKWSDICFDPKRQRCDRVLDCPRGEDEQGCSTIRNATAIQCGEDEEFIEPNQLCDNKNDCSNGFDEEICDKVYCKPPSYFLCENGVCIDGSLVGNGEDDCGDSSDEMVQFQLTKGYAIGIFIVLLSFLFTSLVFRWCSSRRDIDRLINNFPEFPLPPFQGPGEHDSPELYNLSYSDSDFRVGGDVFEAFARTRRRMETENKPNDVSSARTQNVLGNFYTRTWVNAEMEIVSALVSLSLPLKMCIGLNQNIVKMYEKCNNHGMV